MKREMRKVCANCGNNYRKEDKFCRYCGAPNGVPSAVPEDFCCLYGPPPIKRTHTCIKCGYRWETRMMVDRERFCPKCGGNAPASVE